MKHNRHMTFLNMAAVAAVFLFVSCGRQTPSRQHVEATLEQNAEVQALQKKSGNDLVFAGDVNDHSLFTEKFQHQIHGVEVLGSGARYHQSEDGTESISTHLAEINLPPVKVMTLDDVLKRAHELGILSLSGTGSLKILPASEGNSDRMIYVLPLDDGGEVWINAVDGSHVATLNESNDVAPEKMMVRSAENQGIIKILLPGSCSISSVNKEKFKDVSSATCAEKITNSCQVLNWEKSPQSFHPELCRVPKKNDESAQRASINSQKFLDYFKTHHERDSFDGKGARIISVVHAGIKYANATWFKKGGYIAYGDGDDVTFRDFTFATDVAGHELTHALIQHTADLTSFGETGALNESLADFFGTMVEGAGNWTMGEDLFIGGNSNSGLRNLMDPAKLSGQFLSSEGNYVEKPYPASTHEAAPVIEPCTGGNDYCGIHFNATIPGHAWYGIHKVLGQKKAESLIYLALTHYFHELTNFSEAASSTLEACKVSLSEGECHKVKEVFLASGMLK